MTGSVTGVNGTSTGVTGTLPPTTGVTGSVTSYGTGTTAGTNNSSMGKDAFLKLLVAQLRFQDPSKPADASQFLAETAQFTLVEKFEELSQLQAQVLATNDALLTTSRATSAVALVGRTVSWTGTDDTTVSGTVTGVTVVDGVPVLEVGDQKISLDQVIRVQTTQPAESA